MATKKTSKQEKPVVFTPKISHLTYQGDDMWTYALEAELKIPFKVAPIDGGPKDLRDADISIYDIRLKKDGSGVLHVLFNYEGERPSRTKEEHLKADRIDRLSNARSKQLALEHDKALLEKIKQRNPELFK